MQNTAFAQHRTADNDTDIGDIVGHYFMYICMLARRPAVDLAPII